MEERGDHQRLRPFYEAIRSHVEGSRDMLKNVAVEVRESAEWFYDQIEQCRAFGLLSRKLLR